MIKFIRTFFNYFSHFLLKLPSPLNLSYAWNLGSLLGLLIVFQIVRGIILSLSYSNDIIFSFNSIELIERSSFSSILFRVIHVNGVNFIFLFLYLHIFRGLFFFRFNNFMTWNRGILIYVFIIIVAFMGYVLVWGQMSLWGATVITNLFSVIPYIGTSLVIWMWKGFSVNNLTLKLFFRLHFLLPFVILVLIIVHLYSLHIKGRRNPLFITNKFPKVPFDIFFTLKDAIFVLSIAILLIYIEKNVFLDPENYIEADEIRSPVHIKPEWYLTAPYAVLRRIPDKRIGVVALAITIVCFFFLTFVKRNITFSVVEPALIFSALVFGINFLLLIWVGINPVESPFIQLGQVTTVIYFAYFIWTLGYKIWNKILTA